jgi:phytoene dehydrogenase-like protein
MRVLRRLGVMPDGAPPPTTGGFAACADALHTLPTGPLSLLATGLLRLPDKLDAGRFLAKLRRIDAQAIQGMDVASWLRSEGLPPAVGDLIGALVRVTTYSAELESLSAGAALAQLRLGARGVLYLHDGWQQLVDGLAAAAESHGARLHARARATAVVPDGRGFRVRLADGEDILASDVVLALPPRAAADLVAGAPGAALASWAQRLRPVRAACLDLALTGLPRPRRHYAFGTDRPLYVSVHSAVARLAPEGGALVHAARYLAAETPDAAEVERELESLVDLLQPGWRRHLAHRRFLPEMVVSHALVTAEMGGTTGRPGPEVPGAPGLYVAGDWVGPEGMLADASLASASRAAEAIVAGALTDAA